MTLYSLNEIKKEINSLAEKEVEELCLRLAKYKKENKELLSYLLFEAHDEQQYITKIKHMIDEMYSEMNRSNLHFTKKSLRKILRITNKFIKYSGIKITEAELLIYYCTKLKNSGIAIHSSTQLTNLYKRQIEKIKSAVSKLHEDLQYDYNKAIEEL